MFRNVVTLQDAVAIVLLMECSASSTGGPTGFDEVTSSIDPMRGDFPVDEDADNMFRRSQWRLLRHHGMTEMIPVPERVAEDDNPGEAYHSQHSISETQQWNQGQDAFGRCRSSLFSLSQGQTGTATSRRMTGDNHYSPCERHNEWHHYEDQRHTKSHQRNVLSSIQGGDVMQTNGITPTPKMNRKRFRRAEAD